MGGRINGGGGAMDVYLPRSNGDVDDDGKERRTAFSSSCDSVARQFHVSVNNCDSFVGRALTMDRASHDNLVEIAMRSASVAGDGPSRHGGTVLDAIDSAGARGIDSRRECGSGE
ncbi:hypothetical protein GUJ93_ZPchr0030g33463 [Zizania palustris]|uniref:Uncharacterized protein n=1 Tax=Zizania palustris TaxID=103762 RepID=A0A8J5RE07_ZIZPA|nr:hypothetical protein GUJ93_ZPchr0030g33463 [Zizania palustris]